MKLHCEFYTLPRTEKEPEFFTYESLDTEGLEEL